MEQVFYRSQLVSLAVPEHVLAAARELVSGGEDESAFDEVVTKPETALAQQAGLAAYLKLGEKRERSEQERSKLAEKRELAKQEGERKGVEKRAKSKP